MILKPLLLYTFAAGMDVASTRYALAQNPYAREQTPWLRGSEIYALKAAQVAALTALDVKLQKHHKHLAWTLRIMAVAVQGVVAVRNVQRAR